MLLQKLGANTLVKQLLLSLFQGFAPTPFLGVGAQPDPFFKGFCGKLLFQGVGGVAWGFPFSRRFLLIKNPLVHCISKGPEGLARVAVAPGLDGVPLPPPSAGLFDDICIVIKDGLGLKPAGPVHLPLLAKEGVDAPVAFDLFQGLLGQLLLNLLQGGVVPPLAPNP